MKFCILADLHIGVKKSSDAFLKSASVFFFSQLFPYLKEQGIKNIIVLGDVFDTRESVNVKALDFVYKFFSMPFNFTVISGNHDLYHNNTSSITSLVMLHKFSNVELISGYKEIDVEGNKLLFVSWMPDEKELTKIFDESEAKVCFGHFDISGFVYTGNKLNEKSIPIETFSKFDKVFSGHFHTRDTKIINTTEITYCGCPYELTRSDIGNKKGFHIFDSTTSNYEFIENQLSPKYIQVKYPDVVSESVISNNFIDVFVDEKDLEDDLKVKEYLKIFNSEICLQPPTVKIVKSEDYLTEELQLSDESKSIIDLINEYVDVQKDLENKEELKELLNEIYEEVLI